MTVDRALTAEERRLSQTAMRDQSFLSSLAMNCGSETLLILLALSLGFLLAAWIYSGVTSW